MLVSTLFRSKQKNSTVRLSKDCEDIMYEIKWKKKNEFSLEILKWLFQ